MLKSTTLVIIFNIQQSNNRILENLIEQVLNHN